MNAAARRRGALVTAAILGLLALVGPLPGAAALSPDRGYEKVSPDDKAGIDAGLVTSQTGPWVSPTTPEGDGFTYSSFGTHGDGAESSVVGQTLARRGASGWSSRSLNPGPITVFPFSTGFVWSSFTEDLSKGIVHCIDNGGVPQRCEDPPLQTADAVPDTDNHYLVDITGADNTYDFLFSVPQPLGFGSYGGEPSGDLTHAAFELRPDQDDMVHEGFVDGNGNQQARVVSVVGGVEVEGSLGLGYQGNNANPTVVSDDGTRILFGHPGCCTGFGGANGNSTPLSDVYLRDTGPGGPSTTWVSEPEAGVPADPTSPRLDAFQGASSDASKIFFTSGEKLTADSTGDPTPDNQSFGDLYQYDYDTGDLRDISVDTGNPDGARVRGFVGQSDSGDDAYFVAQGQLGTGEGTDGGHNLFHWEDGPGNGSVTLVAELASSDADTYNTNTYLRSARVTPNGRHLLFESDAPLTGDDLGPVGDRDVFHYDSNTDSVECASCGPDASNVDARLRQDPEFPYQLVIHGNITDDGGTVFFETTEGLVAKDTNGAGDVYEFDTTADDLELISDGKSTHDSYFGDATPDGSSVFFFTRAQLTTSDGDDNYDAYVARTGGVFEDDSPAPCQGDDCQGQPSSPPAAPDPGTSNVTGPGNVEAAEDCSKLERKAKKAKRKLKRTKRKLRRARRADQDNKVDRLEKQKKRKAKRAKRANRKLKQCRRQQREGK